MRASRLLEESQDNRKIDAILAHTADEAEENGYTDILEKSTVQLLTQRGLPGLIEIIQYYGHRFRWETLRVAVVELLRNATDPRQVRAFEVMLEAFEDDWEDVDLFPSLSI